MEAPAEATVAGQGAPRARLRVRPRHPAETCGSASVLHPPPGSARVDDLAFSARECGVRIPLCPQTPAPLSRAPCCGEAAFLLRVGLGQHHRQNLQESDGGPRLVPLSMRLVTTILQSKGSAEQRVRP